MEDLSKILKKYQKAMNSISGETPTSRVSTYYDTGNAALNWAITGDFNKGYPGGRLIELFGEPSTGKSLLLNSALACNQQQSGISILDETEYSYTPEFGAITHIDNNQLLLNNSVTVEELYTRLEETLKVTAEVKKPVLYAVDSIAQISTKFEVKEKFEKVDMQRAKQIRKMLRLLSPRIAQTDLAIILANHKMEKQGVMFGDATTTPGGSSIHFQCSVRIELMNSKIIRDEKTNEVIGTYINAFIRKNKMGVPFRRIVLSVMFDKGVNRYSGLGEIAKKYGIIESSGGWYKFIDDSEQKFRFTEVETEKELREKAMKYITKLTRKEENTIERTPKK